MAKKKARPERTRRTRARSAAKAKSAPFFRPFSHLRTPDDAPPPAKAEDAIEPAATAQPTESDVGLTFAEYMAGVRALDGAALRIPKTAAQIERSPSAPAAEDLDAPARDELRSLVLEGLRFEVSDDGERIEGRRIDIEPRELRRLRRGQYAVDGRLDLHGLSAGDARRAVEAFVRKHRGDGDRVVLVVHGKGNHSPRGQGVLRGEIAAWLSQGSAARHIAAFASPPPDLGGSGALLVLLAR